jgi:hypothetical protein
VCVLCFLYCVGSLSSLVANVQYTLSVWTMDQAGWLSGTAAIHSWRVVDRPPIVRVLSGPSKASSLLRPTFHLIALVRLEGHVEDWVMVGVGCGASLEGLGV